MGIMTEAGIAVSVLGKTLHLEPCGTRMDGSKGTGHGTAVARAIWYEESIES